MKKAIVATCCSNKSYGSILQALSLKQALNSLQCESVIVRVNKKTSKKSISYHIKTSIVNIYNSFVIKKRIHERLVRIDSFMNENLDILYYSTYDELKNNLPNADIYISGSDQVWHPDLCNKTYMLDFVPLGGKKFSYAASMGKTIIQDSKQEEFKRLVSAFDTVSVREHDAAIVVSQYTNKKVQEHIDPTFFLSQEEWRIYEKPFSVKKGYILVFAIYWDERLNSKLKELHRCTGCDIVTIQDGFRRIYSNQRIYDADVGQFLWLIDNAGAVITSSFHGVALSIILNKLCIPIINPILPSRIENLLTILHYPMLNINELLGDPSVDFDCVNSHIKDETRKGMNYLKELVDYD